MGLSADQTQEKSIGDLKYRSVEIIQTDKRKKGMEKQKGNLISKSQEVILSTLAYKLLGYQEEKLEQGLI